jgi:hypothetical protein
VKTNRKLNVAVLLLVVLFGFQYGIASAATTRYVAQTGGNDTGNTSCPFANPCQTITKAVLNSISGDTILVYNGTYNESLSSAGLLPQNINIPLTIAAANGQSPVMTGATTITGWTPSGSTWMASWPIKLAPTSGSGLSGINPSGSPYTKYPDQIIENGVNLTNICAPDVGPYNTPGPGQFCINYSNKTVTIGDNPSGNTIQGSIYQTAVKFTSAAAGSTFQGITLINYAPNWNLQGDILVSANNVTINQVQGSHSSCRTLFASGVSGLTVENSSAVQNGNGGMSASTIINATFYNNQFSYNNAAANWITSYDAGGLKITGGSAGSSQITIDSNSATNNGGPGLWLDTRWQKIALTNNYSAFNQNHGIDMESGSNSYVMNNYTYLNQASNAGGIALSKTVGVEVWNNLSQGNFTNIKVTDTCDSSAAASSGNQVVNNIVGGGITGDFDQIYVHNYCVCSIGYPQCGNTALNMVSSSGSNPADAWNQYQTQLNNYSGYHDASYQIGWDTVSGVPTQYSKLSAFQSAVQGREVGSQQVSCTSASCPISMTGTSLPSEIALPLGLVSGNTYGVGQIP